MQNVVDNIKRLFKKPEPREYIPFKQFNYLNQLSQKELCQLLHFVEQRKMVDLVSDLEEKKTLFICYPGTLHFCTRLLDDKTRFLLLYRVCSQNNHFYSSSEDLASLSLNCVKGNLKHLAIKSDYFNVVFAPLSTQTQIDFTPFFSEFFRILPNGGRLVISLIHPHLEFVLYNQNPSSQLQVQNHIQDIVNSLRDNHLYLEQLKEGIVDQNVRPFFITSDNSKPYDEFKGLPLVLFIRAVKFIKNSA